MDDRTTHLLLDEYLATGDNRFLSLLRSVHTPVKLAAVADRLKKDPRPWARAQIFQYLDLPFNQPGHETIVKRLFKHAEAQRDDELMGAFLVAFDRQVRRVVRRRHRYDSLNRQLLSEDHLRSEPNTMRKMKKTTIDGRYGEALAKSNRLFTYHTRYYLRRRAWRYFRGAGFARPKEYVPTVCAALSRYTDEDLGRGEHILDSWSLLHACFFESDVLSFNSTHAKLKDGRGLRELSAAPAFAPLWAATAAATPLLELVLAARSRLVRIWASQLLRRDHADALRQVNAARLVSLFDHHDPEIQRLGADLLRSVGGLETLTLETWLALLKAKDPAALQVVAELMATHVSSDRVSLSLAVQLAIAAPTPVARLGLYYLSERSAVMADELDLIANLAAARCAAVGEVLSRWALARVGAAPVYSIDRIARFFDSLLQEVRQGAWDWLTEASAGYHDPALWARLLETPYDDVRLRFVSALERRRAAPAAAMATDLSQLWASVLLGVHRGGRQKLAALRQISRAVTDDPAGAETLLPILSVAIRSVRPSEARAGLAAVVAVAEARPKLRMAIGRYLPELVLEPEGVA